MGGWFVYVVLTVISVAALGATTLLPEKLWTSHEEEEENEHIQ
jgi:hypothetical protein